VLVKAHRVREPKDIYKVVEPVLRTLTMDPKTQRIRTIQPHEQVESISDNINGSNTKVAIWDETLQEVPDLFEKLKYIEADALEDEILFPEEADEEFDDGLFRPDRSAMTRFEQGNIGDIRRFAYDLDSDEEPEDSEFDASDFSEDDPDIPPNEEEDSEEAEKAFEEFAKKFKDNLSLESGSKHQHYIFDFSDPKHSIDLSRVPDHMKKTDLDVMVLLRDSIAKQKDYSDTSHATLEKEFLRHIDRQKSKSKSKSRDLQFCSASYFTS
jgi:hypothetical protein